MSQDAGRTPAYHIRASLGPLRGAGAQPEALASLAEMLAEAADACAAAQVALAHHAATPPATLADLANAESSRVRQEVAANPNTPQETLRALSGETAPAIRSSLAANPAAPAWLLEALATDTTLRRRQGRGVLLQLAQNTAATSRVLDLVAVHPHCVPLVLATAGIHPHASDALAASSAVADAMALVTGSGPRTDATSQSIDV